MSSTAEEHEALTLAQLLQTDGLPGVFCSPLRPWRDVADETLVHKEDGSPCIEPIPDPALKDLLAHRMNFVKIGGRGPQHLPPPDDIVKNILSRGAWPFASLEAIVEFPYQGTASHANAYGLLLTPIIRQSIRGHVPLALTSHTMQERILGQSKNGIYAQRATWMATGNNIQLGGDIPRRAYWIRMGARSPGRAHHGIASSGPLLVRGGLPSAGKSAATRWVAFKNGSTPLAACSILWALPTFWTTWTTSTRKPTAIHSNGPRSCMPGITSTGSVGSWWPRSSKTSSWVPRRAWCRALSCSTRCPMNSPTSIRATSGASSARRSLLRCRYPRRLAAPAGGGQRDGKHDGGDAVELLARRNGETKESKSGTLQEIARDLVREAKVTLEDAARVGELPPTWVASIMTEAGWQHYHRLRNVGGSAAQMTFTPSRGVTGFDCCETTQAAREPMMQGVAKQTDSEHSVLIESVQIQDTPEVLATDIGAQVGEPCNRCGCTLSYHSGPYQMCHQCYPRPSKFGRLTDEQWYRLRALFPHKPVWLACNAEKDYV